VTSIYPPIGRYWMHQRPKWKPWRKKRAIAVYHSEGMFINRIVAPDNTDGWQAVTIRSTKP
jgi:hypothetical protein